MKKIINILFILFYLSLFSIIVIAESPTPTPDPNLQSSYKMECLELPDSIKENKPKIPPPVLNSTLNGECSNKNGCYLAMCVISLKDLGQLSFEEFNTKYGNSNLSEARSHRELLKMFEGNFNEFCTTGKADRDIFYFGQDFTSILDSYNLVKRGTASFTSSKLKDNFIPFGPVINLPISLINPNDHVYYTFYAISSTGNFSSSSQSLTPSPTNSEANEYSQKISELGMGTQQVGTAPTDGTKEKCVNIAWDPYGRLFDGVSLEPFNRDEATVSLLDKNGNKVAIPNNSVKIDLLGKYNILVRDDGEYKLNVIPLTSHQFTDFSPDVRYKSLYEVIFMPSSPAFYESSVNPKRVDVALKPVNIPYKRTIEVVQNEYKQVWTGGKKYIKITLRVTHPLSLVKLIVNDIFVKENGDGEILPLTTDKNGFWKVLIRDYKVLSQKGFRIQIAKNPDYYLYAGKSDDKITIDYDPILPYIEGYAYDDSNNIIANAIVQVKLKMNGSKFYQTNTDENGYFIIQPKNLPPFDYYFIFIDPKNNSESLKTISKFVNENINYLLEEKIDLLRGTKNGEIVVNNNEGDSRSEDYFEGSKTDINSLNNNSQGNLLNNKNKTNNKLYASLFIIILLLVTVIVFVLFYFKKNFRRNG